VRRAELWALDEGVTFLNHGSYGACPRPVLEQQAALRARLEAQPVRFFARDLEGLLDQARRALAAFVGARAQDLAPVRNATTAVNAVLRSLPLQPGDEVLLTSHGYNACANAVRAVCQRTGAVGVMAQVPFPLLAPEEVVAAVLARVTSRTRVALLDAVTSPTALVWPIAELVRTLESRGVPVLVDGAHAPGMVPLDLEALGASFFTGNLHKWVCAPKGAAFLHVRADRQALVRPAVVSHGANSQRLDRSRFHLEFDWTGTDDPTAFLCAPRALEVLGSLRPGGWPELMAENRLRALAARTLLESRLGVPSLAPASMVGAMVAVPLPQSAEGLQDRLLFEHDIEVPVIRFGPLWLVRVSLQAHVREGDVERLAEALGEAL
jgi:isopenicillin-N epimerase